jgi:hypothetical protein
VQQSLPAASPVPTTPSAMLIPQVFAKTRRRFTWR